MPQLVFRYDDGGQEVLPLTTESIGVGREPDNPISIDNAYISGYHARLDRLADGGYAVTDLNSGNGTFVNDRAIRQTTLRDGDLLRFGIYEVQYVDQRQRTPGSGPAPEGVSHRPADDAILARQLALEAAERELAVRQASVEERIATLKEMEARLGGVEAELEERTFHLETLRREALPQVEGQLEFLQTEEKALAQRVDALRQELARGEQQAGEYQGLESKLIELREAQARMEAELTAKRQALRDLVDDALAAESKLDQAKRSLDETKRSEAESRRALEELTSEKEQLQRRNEATIAAVRELETAKSELERALATERDQCEALNRENARLREHLEQAQDKLTVADERIEGRIEAWDDFEREQLDHIVERKRRVEEQAEVAEKRLAKARDELKSLRDTIKQEGETAQAAMDDLRRNHYEPTREIHEELMLRNEELAHEIALRERRLHQLQTSIQESEATERFVSNDLARKGQRLQALEKRIGDEFERISSEFVSLQRPLGGRKRPSGPEEFGPIFIPSRRRPAAVLPPKPVSPEGSGKLRLAVFDPFSLDSGRDFTDCVELRVAEEPLPMGYAGLAAATRGLFTTSLPEAAEASFPVLFLPGPDLAHTRATIGKLRAALPGQRILLGWRAGVFSALTERLNEGANFQDLLRLLTMADGHLTEEVESQGFLGALHPRGRFLVMPPPMPWNPEDKPGRSEREGFYVALAGFRPDDAGHVAMVREIKDLVESTRQILTLPEVSPGRVRRFNEALDLSDGWTRTIPDPDYPGRLQAMKQHLGVLVFDTLEAGAVEALRDALLAGTPVFGRKGSAVEAFYPQLEPTYDAERQLPVPVKLNRFLEDPALFRDLIRQADQRLLDRYSYPAAARNLEAFLRGGAVREGEALAASS